MIMRPARKSRSMTRRYTDEVSSVKDGDNTKRRRNSRKRKLSDMLGPRWTTEELSCFYDFYRKYSKDWKKVASAVRNRSPVMVESLYTMNMAYLSLPHGTASAAGLIAMMTDHYYNLARSDSDQESNDGAGSCRKTQKCASGKSQSTSSKASDDQSVSHSQVTVPDYGCLSLLKKNCLEGSRPCPVGKRKPRFPISFPYENFSGQNYVSPTRQGLKLKANANDDEVALEIAIALAELSQKGVTSKVSQMPSKIAESVVASSFRYAQIKHSLAETTSTQNLGAAMDEEELEGNNEAETGKLSKYKRSMMEFVSVSTVKKAKPTQLEHKDYEVRDDSESHLNDIKEECSRTKEGKMFGSMIRNFDVEITNSKISRSSGQSRRKKSKKALFGRDGASAFDALHTLADLSLMMPTEDGDDSRLHVKDDDDNPADELVSAEALPMNQKTKKCRFSGVRMKGYRPIPSSEVASSKTLKPGKASFVSCVPEENQDTQPSIAKTPRRKQKMQVSKDGDPGKLMNESKKSSQTGSPHLVRISENSTNDDLQDEASGSAQSAVQVPLVNQVNLPTEVRSLWKVNVKELQIQKHSELFNNISNDQSDLPIISLHSRTLNSKKKLLSCLSNPRLRRWCIYEWFYSAIDYPWFAKNEFAEYLNHVGLGHRLRLTRVEWGLIRSSLGKPRLFSEQFLKEERESLNQYRESVRKHYTELREGIREGLPTDLARPLSVGQHVIAIHPKTREIHNGRVLTVDHSGCRVQFDLHELGVEFVMDIECMPLNPLENLPAALLGKHLKLHRNIQNLVSCCIPSSIIKASQVNDVHQVSPSNTNIQMRVVSTKATDYQQNAYPQPSKPAQIQAKQADVQALAELARALEKKTALVLELRRMNDDVSITQIDGDSSFKDSEPFRKQYAAVLVQLNEANKQVSSALYSLRQRNRYQRNIPLPRVTPDTRFADLGGEHSFNHSASQTSASVSHVNEIINSSKTKAQAMVDEAVQAMSSLKGREDTVEKIEEVIGYVNDRLPSDDSSLHVAPNPKATSTSETQSQIPLELISKCIATLLMIQKCTQHQFPPSDVARVLDSAVRSLQPRSSRNTPVYTEIKKCMGMIRHQVMGLIPTKIINSRT